MKRGAALCALALSVLPTAINAENCNTPAGWDDVKPLLSTHVLVFGEMHGTREVPLLIESILCDLVQNDIPVRYGIEAYRSQTSDLSELVQAPFSDEDAFEAAPGMWASHDGRSSEAVLSMLHQFSKWNSSGGDIDVFAFDADHTKFIEDVGRSRQATMAAMVDEAAQNFDGAMILVAGGYHTPIVRRTMEPVSGTMSNMVTARPVVSFKMMHDGGAAYVTYSMGGSRETTTGELELSSINVEEMPKWTMKIEPFGVHYRGHYSVGTITPSPPALPAED